jgi:hypothetical protein
MRRLMSLAATSLLALIGPRALLAQGAGAGQDEAPSNPWNDGLVPGNYVRMSAGSSTPVSPHAALRYWDRGTTYYAGWENWDTGASGVSRVGFSLNAAYSALPLNTPLFRANFTPLNGGTVTSVSASRAGILEVTSGLRLRMPLPYLMPNLSLGLGLIDWQPGTIHYESTAGSGSAKQQHRVSAEVTVGAGIEKNLFDRYGVFGEALYVYGYTSYGSGFVSSGGVCSSVACDTFRNGNTTIGTLRGGLRVRVGQ